MEGERWLRCVSPDARICMKVPGPASLPEYWTLEFDFYGVEHLDSALTVSGMTADGNIVWSAVFPWGTSMAFRTGEIYSETVFEGASVLGRHHVMVMARGTGVKVYLDTQRMVNVPEVDARHGMPTYLEYRLWATTKPMITNVRFAEGCRPRPDLMGDGKLVTYGIHFKSGSDVVLPESAPILRQVSAYMAAHPTVNLQITGYTDNVGTAASNLDLSKRRAAAVATVLSTQFSVAADRFKTDGKGDGDPIASNKDEQGRAMNRRVVFSKLQ
jgi:outer membrane protein OmpA-like peptidoglycan-associated protein